MFFNNGEDWNSIMNVTAHVCYLGHLSGSRSSMLTRFFRLDGLFDKSFFFVWISALSQCTIVLYMQCSKEILNKTHAYCFMVTLVCFFSLKRNVLQIQPHHILTCCNLYQSPWNITHKHAHACSVSAMFLMATTVKDINGNVMILYVPRYCILYCIKMLVYILKDMTFSDIFCSPYILKVKKNRLCFNQMT